MKKLIVGYAVMLSVMSCGDNSSGSGDSMYDTSARATEGRAMARDSAVAAFHDSVSADTSKKSLVPDSASVSGGGLPSGTIDSGMTNAGAKKPLIKHHKK
jgi:hypothetical protein